MKLFTLKELCQITLNFIAYRLNKRINKQIINLKVFIDSLIEKGYNLTRKKNILTIDSPQAKISLRCYSSDLNVFQQVFIENEYQDLIDIIQKHNISIEAIIDCGANIGLSSVYFHKFFPHAQICAIEPMESNYKMSQLNFKSNKITATVLLGAIWNTKTKLELDFSFRDGKEWSTTTVPLNNGGEIDTFTIPEIMEKMHFSSIDLLKIDIEGAEKQIFDGAISDLSFLNKTKVVVIEIHDEYNCRDMINKVFESYNFHYFNSGELTIGIKL